MVWGGYLEKCACALGAFDDAEVTHVEGDIDPCRDMAIIQNELRLKDAEWVEKQVDTLRKTMRGKGTSSLADKARKEELVSLIGSERVRKDCLWLIAFTYEAGYDGEGTDRAD